MSEPRDFYDVLGVDRSATGDEIKKAYKKLAIRYHPDRNPDNAEAEERFKEATQAYQILSDAEKRSRYDRMGHSAFGGNGNYDAVDFGSVSELLEGLFGEMFGRKRGKSARDITYELEITFVEAATGCEKTIEVKRPAVCQTCKGNGAAPGSRTTPCATCSGKGHVKFQRGIFAASRTCSACSGSGTKIEVPCPTCNAKGTVDRKEEMSVKIPPGVENGSVRTVRGAGEQTVKGSGDLHIYVKVGDHPLFTREGADIVCTAPIGFPQAVLGTQIDIPTLEGRVRMKIPAGTQSGKVFRLRGKGIPVFGGAGKGDQLVRVVVEVPEKINRKQRKLLEELAQEMGTDTLPQQRGFLDKLKELFD